MISANSVTLTNSQRTSILNHGQPITVQQMLAFLGLTGYSRNHIPQYVDLTQPLRDIVAAAGNRNLTAPLKWSVAAEEAFTATKQALAHAASLASPDYDKDFHLDVSETGVVVNPEKGGKQECADVPQFQAELHRKRTNCMCQVHGRVNKSHYKDKLHCYVSPPESQLEPRHHSVSEL